jgi:hypothetical protein
MCFPGAGDSAGMTPRKRDVVAPWFCVPAFRPVCSVQRPPPIGRRGSSRQRPCQRKLNVHAAFRPIPTLDSDQLLGSWPSGIDPPRVCHSASPVGPVQRLSSGQTVAMGQQSVVVGIHRRAEMRGISVGKPTSLSAATMAASHVNSIAYRFEDGRCFPTTWIERPWHKGCKIPDRATEHRGIDGHIHSHR